MFRTAPTLTPETLITTRRRCILYAMNATTKIEWIYNMDNYDNPEEDITPGLHDEYSGKEMNEMQKEIECWQVDNHLASCYKHLRKTQ